MEFAVNDEIFEELKAKAARIGSEINVTNIGVNRDEIRTNITDTINDHSSDLDNYFEDLLGGYVTGSIIHAGVNGYLLYKGSKSKEEALEDTIYSSLISAGGFTASVATEALFAEALALSTLGGPIGVGLALGAGLSSRAILKRVSERRFFVNDLMEANRELNNIINLLEGTKKIKFAA